MIYKRCKCGCSRTSDETKGFRHGGWWFASRHCYDHYCRIVDGKRGFAIDGPEHDEQVRTGRYTLNEELLKRAHALSGTDRDTVESLKARWTPYDDSPIAERAMRSMVADNGATT